MTEPTPLRRLWGTWVCMAHPWHLCTSMFMFVCAVSCSWNAREAVGAIVGPPDLCAVARRCKTHVTLCKVTWHMPFHRTGSGWDVLILPSPAAVAAVVACSYFGRWPCTVNDTVTDVFSTPA